MLNKEQTSNCSKVLYIPSWSFALIVPKSIGSLITS